jgi:cysteine desulfurase
MSDPVYFDNNATTALAPEALEAMVPYLSTLYANPSSASRAGAQVKNAISEARASVAGLLGCRTAELVFTSGATESNHMAILGALALAPEKRHLITSNVEHPSIMLLCRHLELTGVEVTYLPVDADGRIDLAQLTASIRPDTALISLMWANNETGVLFPIEEVAAIAKSHGVLCHTDATQAVGKLPMNMQESGVDMLSCSGHKLHGPKGVGALFVRKGVALPPLIYGHQERGRRGGTENVPAIIGFGVAARLLGDLDAEIAYLSGLRNQLEQGVLALLPEAVVHGLAVKRLPNTSNIAFNTIESEELLHRLEQQGITAATGAACAAGGSRPSHVLSAMGLGREVILSSLRFSLSRYNRREEVDRLLTVLHGLFQTGKAGTPSDSPLVSCAH